MLGLDYDMQHLIAVPVHTDVAALLLFSPAHAWLNPTHTCCPTYMHLDAEAALMQRQVTPMVKALMLR